MTSQIVPLSVLTMETYTSSRAEKTTKSTMQILLSLSQIRMWSTQWSDLGPKRNDPTQNHLRRSRFTQCAAVTSAVEKVQLTCSFGALSHHIAAARTPIGHVHNVDNLTRDKEKHALRVGGNARSQDKEKVKTHQGQDGQRDSIVRRTQSEEANVEKTTKTFLANDACQNVGRFFLAARSRNAKVSHTSFSLACKDAH